MSSGQPNPSDLGLTRQLQIDAVCIQFEQELRTGKCPQIEACLQGHDQPMRSQMLKHLLQLEFEHRVEQGDQLEIDDLLDRFPHDHSLIHIVKDELSRSMRAPATEFLGNSPSPEDRLASSALSESDSSLHGRFLPGTKIAGRYRIVSLLGKGGMGEVYRADDLRLGHTVALKFLPKKLAQDQERLERFQAEVRLTRQISHPNVCRVYDMDEVDGQHFLSMEFIDGEDLRILLRRIGRLPKDKGIQITQQLCAGLAAAHDKAVLHRDLKPANIMIDGRGQVRITDFGLAKLASDPQDQAIVGTPAYMAPEQLRQGETTIQSDLYSVGLILHEVFTGEAVHKADSIPGMVKQHEDSKPSQPSSFVDDMDAAVERVILRCLEKAPDDRPTSARAVASSLPGGDPIAAALAAGETPSPAMIAAAGGVGGLDPRVAGALVATIVLGLIGVLWFSQFSDVNRIGMSKHPQTLAENAREIVRAFGYDNVPVDSAWGFAIDMDHNDYLISSDNPSALLEHMTDEQPPGVFFWYRQSPDVLTYQRSLSPEGVENSFTVTPDDPPMLRSGMILVRTDTKGRLMEFQALPQQRRQADSNSPAPDWLALLEEDSEELLGFSLNSFEPTESTWNPPMICDAQRAWQGSYPNGIPIRVETASYLGRPVYLEVIGQWTRAEHDQGPWPRASTFENFKKTYLALIAILLLSSVGLVAFHFRRGRIDKRGASRLAAFVFLIGMASWLLRCRHVPTIDGNMHQFGLAAAMYLFIAAQLWLFYAAMEPFIRQFWPRILISWNRVLDGQIRDPLVGQHVLIGAAFGVSIWLLGGLMQEVVARLDPKDGHEHGFFNYLPALLGAFRSLSGMLEKMEGAIWVGLIAALLLLIFRMLLRKEWLAAGGVVAFGAIVVGFTVPESWEIRIMTTVCAGCLLALSVVTFIRFGLLSFVVGIFCHSLLNWPITTNTSAWYFETGLTAMLVILAIASYGFYTSVGKRLPLETA